MQEYLTSADTWGASHAGVLWARPVAYFSAEFGFHESMPIYSGGLGILAGDHVKAASDLGVPLVGVGLYYNQGYFQQRLDPTAGNTRSTSTSTAGCCRLACGSIADGTPIASPSTRERDDCRPRVEGHRRPQRGLLLDSDVEGNRPEDRDLTARLYGGDERVRIRQELLLGVGGVRALTALGISPGVIHLNEGHSAFATLELVRQRMHRRHRRGRGQPPGGRAGRLHHAYAGAAGHDRFSPELVEEHLGPLREALGSTRTLARAWTRAHLDDQEPFCMTVLALKLSRRANAVSSLHGQVSRAMWTGSFRGARIGGPARRCRSATSPTAFTSRHGSRRRCNRSTTVTWTGLAAALRGSDLLGGCGSRSTTASCGRRTRR